MGQARPGLEKAVTEILQRHGVAGRKMSYRQAERLTGLSPATIGELAKGNARTMETVRRFALGMGEEVERLLLLAGFVPEEGDRWSTETPSPAIECDPLPIEPEDRKWLERFGRALAKLPPGRERELWKAGLRHNTELLEAFLQLLLSKTENVDRKNEEV
ncbi:MAG: hypothetical protein JWL77_1479 [Chthonomonadaceae bacterium]|nr:hypothetical protein [Chthonomonadaceae bacterium]